MWGMDLNYYNLDKAMALQGSYDSALVVMSVLLALIGSYSGLAAIGRLKSLPTKSIDFFALLFLAAFSMAAGVFSMHFIGMIAFKLPVGVSYNIYTTLWSFLPMFVAVLIALTILMQDELAIYKRVMAGSLVGLGVGLMHYIGMMAMSMDALMVFDGASAIFSIIISMALAVVALNSRNILDKYVPEKRKWILKFVSPVVMAAAMASMHYIGMTATYYYPAEIDMEDAGLLIGAGSLNILTALLFLIVSVFAVIAAYYDQRFYQDESKGSIGFLPSRGVRIKFYIYLIPGALLTVSSLVATYYLHQQANISEMDQRARLDASFVVEAMNIKLREAKVILRATSLSSDLSRVLHHENAQDKKNLQGRFLELILASESFDQIRLLNAKGFEYIRVNYNDGKAEVVSEEMLQDKSGQAYFKEVFDELKRGEIYVSALTLNEEFGQVEQPLKPVIRLSTSIYNDSGQKTGVLVFNYLGSALMDKIDEIKQADDYSVMLLDEQGHYLKGPTEEENWSEQLGISGGFRNEFASIWSMIYQLKKGQVTDKRGIFTFDEISTEFKSKDKVGFRYWKVVLHVQPIKWTVQDLKDHPIFVTSVILAILIYIIAARFVAIAVVATYKDRRRIDDLLHEVEFQKFALDEHAIVSITDVKGDITYVNDKFCKISGYEREEIIGKNHRILKSDEHSDEFYKNLWKTIAIGNVWNGELKNFTKNGGYYWVNASIVPFLNDKGKPFRYIAIRTDITAQSEVSEQLEYALDKSFEATQAKTDFLANMSHEIRTPMNAIIGLTDLCLQTELSSRQRDYVWKTNAAGKSLLGIINDILDVSKIEAGKMDIEAIPFNLDKVFDNVWTIMSDRACDKGLELLFSRTKDVPFNLIGDPLRLGQILINLVSNAIKFTESGEVVLYVTSEKNTDGKINLTFSVKDTGIGMTGEQVEGLFKSFSQADTSTSRNYGGTGLGLSISKQLINLMGGEIWAQSEYGSGSSFHFSLELDVDDNMAFDDVFISTELQGKSALVVDDNDTARDILTQYLDDFGFNVTLAKSGQEALNILENANPPIDLVMMDWCMPMMDGMESARRIKNDPRIAVSPRIIMVSAFVREDILSEDGSENLSGFITKPVSPSSLYDGIMEAFGKNAHASMMVRGANKISLEHLIPIQGARILLVEDNEINQQVASENLMNAKLVVDIAENGQIALDMLEANDYDLVLMDIQMPVMDGYEATRLIRSQEKYKSLPVLAMTANATVEDKKKTARAGMNGHISKPIDPVDMFNQLLEHIEPGDREIPAVTLNQASDDEERDLSSIKGLDSAAGIIRIGGSEASYRKILTKFVNSQMDAVDKISQALDANEQDEAQSLLHTLKGVSGNIAAVTLEQATKELEKAMKVGAVSSSDSLFEDVEAAFNQLVADIKVHMDGNVKKEFAVSQALSHDELLVNLEKLKIIIDGFDVEAENALEDIIGKVSDKNLLKVLREINEQLSNYDFEAAGLKLEKLIGGL